MRARFLDFWRSTVGKKVVMAVTGLAMLGFLVTHVLANLLVYLGPEWINGYGAALHATGPLLWAVRLGLFVAFVLHLLVAAQLTVRSRRPRALRYAVIEPQASTTAARTIRWTGVALLAFVVFHTLQMTLGVAHPHFVHLDDYSNVVRVFRLGWMVPLYLAALLALGLHLYHGAWSSVRTLGFAPASPTPLRRPLAAVVAVSMALAFATIPLAVRAGWVGRSVPPEGSGTAAVTTPNGTTATARSPGDSTTLTAAAAPAPRRDARRPPSRPPLPGTARPGGP